MQTVQSIEKGGRESETETEAMREGRREKRKCRLLFIRIGMFSVFCISSGDLLSNGTARTVSSG